MEVHEFELILEGADIHSDENFSALVEGGCDDGNYGSCGTQQQGYFYREAPTFEQAVLSAIRDVEGAVPGLKVVRVEPDELVTMATIAERTGRTRQSVSQLSSGQRGPGGFPAAVTWIDANTRVWRWSEVSAWFAEAKGEPPEIDPARAEFLALLNAQLAVRRHRARLAALGKPVPELPESDEPTLAPARAATG